MQKKAPIYSVDWREAPALNDFASLHLVDKIKRTKNASELKFVLADDTHANLWRRRERAHAAKKRKDEATKKLRQTKLEAQFESRRHVRRQTMTCSRRHCRRRRRRRRCRRRRCRCAFWPRHCRSRRGPPPLERHHGARAAARSATERGAQLAADPWRGESGREKKCRGKSPRVHTTEAGRRKTRGTQKRKITRKRARQRAPTERRRRRTRTTSARSAAAAADAVRPTLAVAEIDARGPPHAKSARASQNSARVDGLSTSIWPSCRRHRKRRCADGVECWQWRARAPFFTSPPGIRRSRALRLV